MSLPASFWTKIQTLTQPLPASEQYFKLRFERSMFGNQFAVKMFRGRKEKPAYNVRFNSIEDRERWITTQKSYEDTHERDRQHYKAEQSALNDSLSVGDILVNKWGYEQTNVDFWQIVKRTSETITIMQIESDEKQVRPQDMAGYSMPCVNVFKSNKQVLKKIVALNMKKWDGTPQRFTAYA